MRGRLYQTRHHVNRIVFYLVKIFERSFLGNQRCLFGWKSAHERNVDCNRQCCSCLQQSAHTLRLSHVSDKTYRADVFFGLLQRRKEQRRRQSRKAMHGEAGDCASLPAVFHSLLHGMRRAAGWRTRKIAPSQRAPARVAGGRTEKNGGSAAGTSLQEMPSFPALCPKSAEGRIRRSDRRSAFQSRSHSPRGAKVSLSLSLSRGQFEKSGMWRCESSGGGSGAMDDAGASPVDGAAAGASGYAVSRLAGTLHQTILHVNRRTFFIPLTQGTGAFSA